MESMLPELDSDVVGKVLWANGILTDFNLPMGQQVRRALPADRMSRYAKWEFVSWCDSLVAKGMDREAPWLLLISRPQKGGVVGFPCKGTYSTGCR